MILNLLPNHFVFFVNFDVLKSGIISVGDNSLRYESGLPNRQSPKTTKHGAIARNLFSLLLKASPLCPQGPIKTRLFCIPVEIRACVGIDQSQGIELRIV